MVPLFKLSLMLGAKVIAVALDFIPVAVKDRTAPTVTGKLNFFTTI
jgi:hypothetical protein